MSSPLYPRKSYDVDGTPFIRINTFCLSQETNFVSFIAVWNNSKEETASKAFVPNFLLLFDKYSTS